MSWRGAELGVRRRIEIAVRGLFESVRGRRKDVALRRLAERDLPRNGTVNA